MCKKQELQKEALGLACNRPTRPVLQQLSFQQQLLAAATAGEAAATAGEAAARCCCGNVDFPSCRSCRSTVLPATAATALPGAAATALTAAPAIATTAGARLLNSVLSLPSGIQQSLGEALWSLIAHAPRAAAALVKGNFFLLEERNQRECSVSRSSSSSDHLLLLLLRGPPPLRHLIRPLRRC
ncbi:hypothetical protein Esti_004430 [Eimeria stiedai]